MPRYSPAWIVHLYDRDRHGAGQAAGSGPDRPVFPVKKLRRRR